MWLIYTPNLLLRPKLTINNQGVSYFTGMCAISKGASQIAMFLKGVSSGFYPVAGFASRYCCRFLIIKKNLSTV